MKKWKTLVNPADPSHWADVSNMWPTGAGSYEVVDPYDAADTSLTATGEGGPLVSAWVFGGITAAKVYVIGDYIWQLSSALASPTDRTGALGANAVSKETGGHACQYGDVTIVTRGTSASLIYATTGNFAALAGSPSARFVVSQSNCVVAFNTSANADAWAATDVGDYTNWTTGEAASGRILENSGPITGAIAYGNDIIVFKQDSIFRMTYVGGTIKWQIQRIYDGIGLADRKEYGVGAGTSDASNGCCAVIETAAGLFFPGGLRTRGTTAESSMRYYLFDGVSPPRCVNMDVSVGLEIGTPVFDSTTGTVTIFDYLSGVPNIDNTRYYYNIYDDAWGKSSTTTATQYHIPLRGTSAANNLTVFGESPNRAYFTYGTDAIKFRARQAASTSTAYTAYIQTHKMSGAGKGFWGEDQWTFGPAAPVLRSRNNSGTSPALTMTVDTYAVAHDTSASATATVSEATTKDRFDFTKSDTYCQLKLNVTDTYLDIDDISCRIVPSGAR